MPKRGAFALGLTALALVLLLSFQTPAQITPATRSGSTSVAVANGTSNSRGPAATEAPTTGGSTATGAPTNAPATEAPATGARTVAGPTVDTRFGPVQVSITVDGGQVTDVVALQLPDGDRHSAQISSISEPMLRTQALAAQSGSIDGVSGATYTSTAYARSLQAALDSAGI